MSQKPSKPKKFRLLAPLLKFFQRRPNVILSQEPSNSSKPKTPENSETFIVIPKKPETFKLLKLPLLALQAVLKPMAHRDVFVLSLCSKRTFNILKMCKLKANWICYADDRCAFSVYSRQSYDSKDLVFSAKHLGEFDPGLEKNMTVIRLGGINVECIWRKDGIEYLYDEYGIQRVVENHIHGLFTAKYIDLKLPKSKYSVALYPNVSKVTDLIISSGSIDPWHLEEILQKYPNLESIRINGKIDYDSLLGAGIFNVRNVFLRYSNQWAPHFWRNFKGRYLVLLLAARYCEDEILRFVNDWISGEKYLNLEFIDVMNCEVKRNNEWIHKLNALEKKNWNRPPIYEYWQRVIGFERNRKSTMRLDWNGHESLMDFERKTDQKMATLITYREFNGFKFVVWN